MFFFLLLLIPSFSAADGCQGYIFDNDTNSDSIVTNCGIGQDCPQGWNIVAVAATTQIEHFTSFLLDMSNASSYCQSPSYYMTYFQDFLNPCAFDHTPNFFQNYYTQGQFVDNFTDGTDYGWDDLADMLLATTNCIMNYLAETTGGMVYVYVDIECSSACSSAKFLDYQAYFTASLTRLGYSIEIYFSNGGGGGCDPVFEQCLWASNCQISHHTYPTPLCSPASSPNATNALQISAFEMAFSLSISTLLLLGIIFVNVVVICQRHSRVKEAYETLRRKHLPASNEYVDRERKMDHWEIVPGNLEVFTNDVLGTGAFSVVYKGRLTGRRPVDEIVKTVQLKSEFTDEVAVKRPPAYADSAAKHDFFEEIKFMKKLGYHVHILGMIGCVTATDSPMIVLPYCEHGDLLHFLHANKERFLEEESPLKSKELLSISWQISDGMCFLKSLDLIHRDLASRNVLISRDYTAKISDFGLCRQPKVTDTSSVYISKGGRLPVKWMAPESLSDYVFSLYTDVWSFGVTLWELFSLGESPYSRINGGAIYDVLETGERLEQLPIIPDDLYNLMMKCWKWEAEERAEIEELRMELNEMLTSSSQYYGYLSMPKAVVKEEDELAEVTV